MRVNWKVRFKNKIWLASFFSAIITFVYTILGMFDVYPDVTRNEIGEIINSLLLFMSLTGVIVDPTTAGLNDSNRAMGYDDPYADSTDDTEEHSAEPDDEMDRLFEEAEVPSESTESTPPATEDVETN